MHLATNRAVRQRTASLAVLFGLLCSVLHFTPAAAYQPATAALPRVPDAPAVVNSAATLPAWAIEWHYVAQGNLYERKNNQSTKAKRHIEIIGSARVREGEDGFMVAQPMQLTVTDEREETMTWHSSSPTWFTTRHRITDPARYTGGPDQILGHPFDFEPQQQDDGSWIFPPDIFGLNFFINGDLAREFNYRTDAVDSRDGPLEPFFMEWGPYSTILLNQPLNSKQFPGIPGNATGDFFSLTTNYTAPEIDGSMRLNVQATVSARKLGGCHAKPAPIDGKDPVLKTVDVSLDAAEPEILPDGEATIRARVTCEGVPVKNARLTLGGYAQESSGGHEHGASPLGAFSDRPRGYLNDVKITNNNWVKTTTITTGADGTATFTFKPGKDTKHERIGIAGSYELHAHALDYRLGQDTITIVARVPGLQRLRPTGPHHIATASWTQEGHDDHIWGTPATLRAIEQVAREFVEVQEIMNRELAAEGKNPRPITKLWVDDISLKDGGLFDVTGWDVEAGKVRGAPWQPPHYTHRDGTVVDFKTRNFLFMYPRDKYTAAERDYIYQDLRTALRIIGSWYGKWLGGPTMTLRAAQTTSGAAHPEALAPRPAVEAFLIDHEEHPSVAPKQEVRIALAPHNYGGDTAAADTVLTAKVPTGLTFRHAEPAPTRFDQAGQPVWELGTLQAKRIVHPIALTLAVDASVRVGTTLTTTAQLVSKSDRDPADNAASVAVVVRPSGADLVVTSSLADAVVTPDGPAVFAVDVANWGTAASTDTQLAVTVPATLTVRSATPAATRIGRELRWNLGDLAIDASRAVTITAELQPGFPAASTPVLDVSMVASTANEIDTANNRLDVRKTVVANGSDVAVALAPVTPDNEGRQRFMLRYGNYGNAIAASATISVSLGAGLSVVTAEPAATRSTRDQQWPGGVSRWELGKLEPGAEGTIMLEVRAGSLPVDGSLLMAVAETTSTDTDTSNNAATELVISARNAMPAEQRVFLPMVRR